MKTFKVGEYVHVPQNTLIWDMDEGGDVKSYVRTEAPGALMLVGIVPDTKFVGDKVYQVFYEGKVFAVSQDNVYKISNLEER